MRRRTTMLVVAGVGIALGGLGFLAGYHVAGATEPRRPTMLTGQDWAAFGFREKELYLSGFVAGAAAEQVRDLAAASGAAPDSSAVSSAAIERLHAARQLRYSYAPSVYSAQIDDFYWWKNHVDVPIVDVMIAINRQMKGE